MHLFINLIRKYRDVLFLLLLSVFVSVLWYGPSFGRMIISNDTGYPLNPIAFFQNRFFAWNNASNLGASQIEMFGTLAFHGIEAFLTYFTKSLIFGQQIYVIFWFFLPMLAIYTMVKRLPVFRKIPYMALFAALLYQFNFFQLQGWTIIWRARFAIYIVVPLIFLLFVDYLEGRRRLIPAALLGSLLLSIFNAGGAPPAYGSVILLIIVIMLFYVLINLRNSFFVYLAKGTYFILVFAVFFFIISGFWTIPYVYYASRSYSTGYSAMGGAGNIVAWADVANRNASILNLLRLQGLDLLNPDSQKDYLTIFLTNPFLVIISFLWPILATSSIFFMKKHQEKKYIILMLLLALVGLVFSAGSHEPFRNFFIFLLKNIPGYAIFRTATYKFGGLLWFAYSILIAFSLSTIIGKITDTVKHRKLLKINTATISAVLLSFLILLFNYPFFTKKFFAWSPPLTTLEKVPEYVFAFGKWADNLPRDNERIILTPKLNPVWHADTYKWNYFSLQTVPALLTMHPVLSNDASTSQIDTAVFLDVYYKSLIDGTDEWQKLNRLLGIKYILQRNDTFYNLSWANSENPRKYNKKLSAMNDVKLEKEFGEWQIYSIDDKYFTPHFYIPENLYYLNGDTYDFVNNLTLFPPDNRAAYYIAAVNTTSFTPQFDFDSYIVMPGNPCCFSFSKASRSSSNEYKSLIDADGIKTVFFDQNFSWQIPKEGKYKILVRSGRPFTNGENIVLTVDSVEIKRRMTDDDRKTDWIDLGEKDLPGGEHSLAVSVDGSPIRVLKAGDIVLVNTAATPKPVPKIVFQKINNTKYRIHVSNVKSAYNLVFNESFNSDWKLYLDKNNKKQDNAIITSYFDGEIQENNHTNSFINKDIFETLFLKNLPDSRHTRVNGYANAWWIKPEDAGGKAEYDLIVEYFPQRLFYFGCIITVLTLIGSLSYLTIMRRKVRARVPA